MAGSKGPANPCTDHRSLIQLVAENKPDPIQASGSTHTATLENHTGQDLFDACATIGVSASAGTMIALGASGGATCNHRWGQVPGGKRSSLPVPVLLTNRPPALVRDHVSATVTWTLSASQPQNGLPSKTYKRRCHCALTIP
jgi:hypothetical protein